MKSRQKSPKLKRKAVEDFLFQAHRAWLAVRGDLPILIALPGILASFPLVAQALYLYHIPGHDAPEWILDLGPVSVLSLAVVGTVAQAYTVHSFHLFSGRARTSLVGAWGFLVLLICYLITAAAVSHWPAPSLWDVAAIAAAPLVIEGSIALVVLVWAASREQASRDLRRAEIAHRAQQAARAGKSGPQRVLAALSELGGEASESELADATKLDLQVIKGALTRLEKKEQITKEPGGMVKLRAEPGAA